MDRYLGKKMFRFYQIVCVHNCISIQIILFLFLAMKLSHSSNAPNYLNDTVQYLNDLHDSLSMYHLDFGDFPSPEKKSPYGLQRLTSPNPYISALRSDVFVKNEWKNKAIYNDLNRQYLGNRIKMSLLFLTDMIVLVLCIINIYQYFKKEKKILTGIGYFILWLGISGFVIAIAFIARVTIPDLFYLPIGLREDLLFYHTRPVLFTSEEAYRYGKTKDGCAVVISAGPDGIYQSESLKIDHYDSPYIRKNMITYSITNGILSNGEIWIMVDDDMKEK